MQKAAGISVVARGDDVAQAVVPLVAVVGVVAAEDVHQRIDGNVIDVALSGGISLQSGSVCAHTNHPSTAKLNLRAVFPDGFGTPIISHCYINPPVDAQADAVGGVVGPAQ